MRIVVLDGYAINNGDITWNDFEQLGDFKVYPRTSKEDIIERAKDAEMILLNKVPMKEETLLQLPKLMQDWLGFQCLQCKNLTSTSQTQIYWCPCNGL